MSRVAPNARSQSPLTSTTTMIETPINLPSGDPQRTRAGNDSLVRAYQAIYQNQVERALVHLHNAMAQFGWDTFGGPVSTSYPCRCWRAWVGMHARHRVRAYDLIENGTFAYTTTEEAMLRDLEHLCYEIMDARCEEITF